MSRLLEPSLCLLGGTVTIGLGFVILAAPPPILAPSLAQVSFVDTKYEIHIEILRHLDIFDHRGGPVWDSNVFSKLVTYRPTLSKFKGGPVKKKHVFILPNFTLLQILKAFFRYVAVLDFMDSACLLASSPPSPL